VPSAVPAGDCRGQLGAHGAAAAGGRPELDPPGRRYCEQPAACDHTTRSTHPPPASSSGSLAAAPPLPSPTSATPPSCPPEASTPRGDQSRQSAPPAWQAASRGAPPATEAITNSLSIPIAELVLDRAAGHARVPLLRPDQRAGVYAAGDSAGPSPGRGRHRVGSSAGQPTFGRRRQICDYRPRVTREARSAKGHAAPPVEAVAREVVCA